MDNKQQLAEYINQELQSGKSPNDIKTALLSAGWTNEDVDAALSNSVQQVASNQQSEAANSPAEMSKAPFLRIIDSFKNKKVLVLACVGIVLFLGIMTLFLSRSSKPQPSSIVNKPTSAASTTISLTPTPQPSAKITGDVIECEDNMSCFIQASTGCKPAKLKSEQKVELFGVENTTVTYSEIKGYKDNKCEFYLRTESIDLVFPSDVPAEIVKTQRDLYKSFEGNDGTCMFNDRDLTNLLLKWDKGIFDSGDVSCSLSPSGSECTTEGGDFSKAICTGAYFEQFSQQN